jgi:hypothetical protein
LESADRGLESPRNPPTGMSALQETGVKPLNAAYFS